MLIKFLPVTSEDFPQKRGWGFIGADSTPFMKEQNSMKKEVKNPYP
jgi:hypothetical protein